MGKQKRDKKTLRKEWIQKLEKPQAMKIDGAKIICLVCEAGFTFNQKSELEQHVKTLRHRTKETTFFNSAQRQILLSQSVDNGLTEFKKDLSRAFVSAGIAWNKLSNPDLAYFLQKYTGKSIPDESTLRKNYLPQLYAQAIKEIRRDIGINPVWLSVEETTDANGRYIANVLVGALRKDEHSKSHIILSRQLEATNNNSITKVVLDSLQIIWPGSKQEDIEKKFLLLLTDGVAYMIKAGKNLKNIYGKLIHVTCVAHGLNRIAEEIRSKFPELDKFISSMKSAFKKAPSRVAVYKKTCPDLPLPPQPVITRWGTWLDAADFYAKHFNKIKEVIEHLNNDSTAVNTLQELILSPEIPKNLAYLSANYTFLSTKMIEIQERNATLKQSLQYLADVETKIFSVGGEIGKQIIQKYKTVVGNNPDLEKLQTISYILSGDSVDEDAESIKGMNPIEVAAFQYSPITSVEVERSFSMHKFLLSDRRRRLTPEHLGMELISHFECLSEV